MQQPCLALVVNKNFNKVNTENNAPLSRFKRRQDDTKCIVFPPLKTKYIQGEQRNAF